MTPKVVIDTDAGLDDAHAILMALAAHKRGDIDVIAITTVSGNTTVHNVNNNVLRILDMVGLLKIPVYPGAVRSLVVPFVNPCEPYHGHDGFGDASHPTPVPAVSTLQKQNAAVTMVQLAQQGHSTGDKITLVTLGPLTNVAVAIKLDPNFTDHLLDIYIMGGNTAATGNMALTKMSSAEFNFLYDPEAAHIVLEETTKPIHLAPWEFSLDVIDVSYEERFSFAQMRTPQAELMSRIETKLLAKREYPRYITCDQMAMAWLIDDARNGQIGNLNSKERKGSELVTAKLVTPELVTSVKSCFASVEIQGALTRGQMVIDYMENAKRKHNVNIVTSIDQELYKKYLRSGYGDNQGL